MEKYIYAISCKRSRGMATDFYIVNPVYSDAETANKKAEKFREQYSSYIDRNGVKCSCVFKVDKIKVS